MPDKAVVVIQDESDLRFLNGKAVLLHHAHLKSGRRNIKGCGLCSNSMGAILTDLKREVPEPKLDEGRGADGEGDSPLPRDPWGVGEEKRPVS